MNIIEKLARSWWVLISLIIFFNGFGFIYIGFKTDNRKWVLEGVTYEIPWIFLIAFLALPGPITGGVFGIGLFLMLVSLIRSVWVDTKYLDMREKHI